VVMMGASGYWGVHALSGMTLTMLQTDAQMSESAGRARANVLGLRRFEKDAFLNIGKKDKEQEYLTKWNEQYDHLSARIGELEKANILPKDKEIVNAMKKDAVGYHSGFNKVFRMIQEDKIKTPQEANAAINDVKEVIHRLEQAAKDLAEEGNKRMDASEGLVMAATNRTTWIMTILAMVSVVLGTGLGFGLSESITKLLLKVIGGLTEASEQVSSASGEVSSASQSLAEGASQQAASVE
jgi:methyl-accepting chemotaxis protein